LFLFYRIPPSLLLRFLKMFPIGVLIGTPPSLSSIVRVLFFLPIVSNVFSLLLPILISVLHLVSPCHASLCPISVSPLFLPAPDPRPPCKEWMRNFVPILPQKTIERLFRRRVHWTRFPLFPLLTFPFLLRLPRLSPAAEPRLERDLQAI